jgi:transposase
MSKKQYTEEFKEEAIRLIRERGESVGRVSERLGVTKNTLYKWNNRSNRAEIGGDNNELIKENKRLLKALRLAEEERDILKKAAAYFANQSR